MVTTYQSTVDRHTSPTTVKRLLLTRRGTPNTYNPLSYFLQYIYSIKKQTSYYYLFLFLYLDI